MADALSLTELLDELARRGLRVTHVGFEGGRVAEFSAVPAEKAYGPSFPAEAVENQSADPDALDAFMKLKGRT